jgi:hypothetical protein
MAGIGSLARLAPGRAGLVLAIGLVVATLANGAYGYLARLGILDQARFQEYVQLYCGSGGDRTAPLAVACRCMQIHTGVDYSVAPSPAYLYGTDGYRFALKLGKDALFGLVLLLSLAWSPHWRWRAAPIADLAPAALSTAVLVGGFVVSLVAHGPLYAALGLRSFEFVAVAVLAAWATPLLGGVARALLVLLAIESLLVVVEMLFGAPIRTCPNSFRAAGTMVLPNSLGVATALYVSFCTAFRPDAVRRPWPWLAALWIVLASGSGAGTGLLFIAAAAHVLRSVPAQRRRDALAVAAVGALAVGVLLPTLTQRPQIYDSLFGLDGRVDKAMQVVRAASPAQRLFGQGMGYGTNGAVNLANSSFIPARKLAADTEFYADSTITSFLMQFGLVGVLAWILVLAWAWLRDPVARPFYLAVGVASLVINVPELFPVNLLLGLALAHTFAHRGLTGIRA